MEEKIYEDIYFTLVTHAESAASDIAAAIMTSLASKYLLPVTLEYGVHFRGVDVDSGEPHEGYLVAEDLADARALHARVPQINGGEDPHGVRLAVRAVGAWHPHT